MWAENYLHNDLNLRNIVIAPCNEYRAYVSELQGYLKSFGRTTSKDLYDKKGDTCKFSEDMRAFISKILAGSLEAVEVHLGLRTEEEMKAQAEKREKKPKDK